MVPRSSLRVFWHCQRCHPWRRAPDRSFQSTGHLFSGHNRWSKIKHDKGKEDALKSKARSILSNHVYLASKSGGPNPTLNPRLAEAINNAKRGALSRTSIDSAIAKGQGKSLSGAPLDALTIEAMLPSSVATIIECQTDQKGRVLQDLRSIITRYGGSLTPTGFLFEKKGRIILEKKDGVGPDEVLEEAIEAGALDVSVDDEGQVFVDTEPADLSAVAEKLGQALGVLVESASIIYDPKQESMVSLEGAAANELQTVIGMLEDDPSVQDIYVNAT